MNLLTVQSARIATLTAITLSMLGLAGHPAEAQEYPSRPLRIVVPYPAGGGTDTVARLIGPKLADAFKQPVIVDNKPGASTSIGTDFVAKAPADGYTLLLQAPNIVTNETLAINPPWTARDFTGVVLLVKYANVLVTGPATPISDLNQLILLSKGPGKPLTYGTPGVASLSHLSTELLKALTGLKMEHIGYKGSAPLTPDLLGGHLPLATDNLNGQLTNIKSGKIRPLVVLSSRRSPVAPEIPSLAEHGINDFEGGGWYCIVVNAKTPTPVIARLNQEINTALRMPDVREKISAMGVEIVGGTVDEFNRHLATEARKWGEIIKSAGIKNE
jgi:tripartite-type tricarboxylate transporter receptor subunit TctC